MNMAEQIRELFINRDDLYFQQYVNGTKCGYKAVNAQVTPGIIQNHLERRITLSWPVLSQQLTCKWCAWDSDRLDGSLDSIEATLRNFGFNPLRESKRAGRDGHTWLFFDEPVPAHRLVRFNTEVLLHAQVPPSDIEFFPKSITAGSQLRGPLGLHRKPGAGVIGWFEGAPQVVAEQVEWLWAQRRSSTDAVFRITELLFERDLQSRQFVRYVKPNFFPDVSFDILTKIQDKKWMGKGWAAQCPLCAAEGHDRHEDNLRISESGERFTCVFRGPGVVHKASMIAAFLGSQLVLEGNTR